jgi:predicted permease
MAVLTLALGIGGNAAVFSVVNGVLLKPLDLPEPDRLVSVWHTAPGMDIVFGYQSPALHLTYREHNRVFEDIGMWGATALSVTGVAEPERVAGVRVTDGTLRLLGVRPHLGRLFTGEDDSADGPATVVLSFGYWQTRLAGDPDVLGRLLTIDGAPHAVIGVLPEGFRFLDRDAALFVPFRLDRSRVIFGNFSFRAVARLKPGVTLEQANQDVARMIPMAAEAFPMPPGLSTDIVKSSGLAPALRPLKEDIVGDVGGVLWVLLGTVGLVLLIACANVANLFLVRSEARQQEMAVRTALGASPLALARDYLREAFLLGLLGGFVGLWMGWWGVRFLVAVGPENLPRLDEISVDSRVLVFTLGVSVLAGMLFGMVPVLRLGRRSPVTALKEGGRGGSVGRHRLRVRSVLVVAQVALALVLLVGSGLMIRSFWALRAVEPGFADPGTVQSLRVFIPPGEPGDELATARRHEEILRALEQIPGVESVGATTAVPMDGVNSMDPVFARDFPVEGDRIPDLRRYEWVLPGYHETLGAELLAGRTLTWDDIHARARVVVISEGLARTFWSSPQEAIGKEVRESPVSPWRRVVGVVGDVRSLGVDQAAPPTVYWPLVLESFWTNDTFVPRNLGFVLRTARAGTTSLLAELREAVWSVDPSLPVAGVQSLDVLVGRSLARTSFTLVMLAIAAAVALLLGVIGIYGVIAYTVSLRLREFGVRMALGARRTDINRLVIGQGLVLSCVGVAAGLVIAAALTGVMSSLLYGVSATDPFTFATVAATLVAIAALASYLPARRAARIDPNQALRWE